MPTSEALVLLGLRNVHNACLVETGGERASEARRHVLRDDESRIDVVVQVPEQGDQRFWTPSRCADDDDLGGSPLEHGGLASPLRFRTRLCIEAQTLAGVGPER